MKMKTKTKKMKKKAKTKTKMKTTKKNENENNCCTSRLTKREFGTTRSRAKFSNKNPKSLLDQVRDSSPSMAPLGYVLGQSRDC